MFQSLCPKHHLSHIPAQKADPSYTLEVSLKGLSVPLTSWWSLLITTGAWITEVTSGTPETPVKTWKHFFQQAIYHPTHWNFSISNSLVDSQCNTNSSFLVRVQDSGLGSHDLDRIQRRNQLLPGTCLFGKLLLNTQNTHPIGLTSQL